MKSRRTFEPNKNLFLLLLILALLSIAEGHSFLLWPRPYVRGYSPDGCVGTRCNACPPLYKNHDMMNNSEDRPEATWKRGQRVMVRWAKNNHVGGFVRFSIVPVRKMMNVKVHDRLAFYYGCWEQGHHSCYNPKKHCGEDKYATALRQSIIIPNNILDGVYVFGFLWYGGLHHAGQVSRFADYPSCSFIRIKGGTPLSRSFQPYFNPGPHRRRMKCLTYADHPRVCTKPFPGCFGYRSFRAIPKEFQNNTEPPKIYWTAFRRRRRT